MRTEVAEIRDVLNETLSEMEYEIAEFQTSLRMLRLNAINKYSDIVNNDEAYLKAILKDSFECSVTNNMIITKINKHCANDNLFNTAVDKIKDSYNIMKKNNIDTFDFTMMESRQSEPFELANLLYSIYRENMYIFLDKIDEYGPDCDSELDEIVTFIFKNAADETATSPISNAEAINNNTINTLTDYINKKFDKWYDILKTNPKLLNYDVLCYVSYLYQLLYMYNYK